MLNKIRQTVRFFRNSSLALIHMKKVFELSTDFTRLFRPILDVRMRWGSTLATCKWNVKIERVIKDAHQSFIREPLSNTESIDETLIETVLFQDIINVLQGIDDVTMILSKSNSPTIQDVEVLTASIISLVNTFQKSQSLISYFAGTLQGDILNWRVMLFNQFPIAGLLCCRCPHF